jgi:transposase
MELPFRNIAHNLSLLLGTVHNHFKRFNATGEVSTIPRGQDNDKRALSDHQSLLLFSNSALYLSEICHLMKETTSISISAPTVCRIIHKHGLTRKKIRQVALCVPKGEVYG